MLTLMDDYTRECLAIRVERRLRPYQAIEALSDVMLSRGIPENIRSDIENTRGEEESTACDSSPVYLLRD
jgi:hypothetical protein